MKREHFCTVCCKRKRRERGLLPATSRYVSKRIRYVHSESRRVGQPFLIVSGEYGLVGPMDPIPWYNHTLQPDEVDALVPTVAEQLVARGVSTLIFYARPSSTLGWQPYYSLLERACVHEGIPMEVRLLGSEFI